MNQMTTKDICIKIGNIAKEVLEIILGILIIIYTRTIYAHLTIVNLHFNILLSGTIIALLLINILLKKIEIKKIKKYAKYLIIYYIYITFFLAFSYIGDRSFWANFYIVFPGFFSLILFNKDDELLKKLFKKIIYITVVLAIISLIFYVLGSLTNIIKPNTYVTYDWGQVRTSESYYYLHFNTQRVGTFGLNIWRNTGIFTEAPMYSLILSIALILNMFIIDGKSKLDKIFSIILLTTVVSTFSATGLVIVTLSIITKMFLELKNKNNLKKVCVLLFSIILIIISIITVSMRSKMKTGSIRTDDYRASFNAWLDYPIMGNGYNNEAAIKSYMLPTREDYGLSNTLGVILAEGGIYLLLFYIFPIMYLIVKYWQNKKYKSVAFYFMFFILIALCIFTYTPLMFLIMAGAYNSVVKRKFKNEKIGD